MKNNGRSKALTRRGLAFLLAAVITMGYILPGGAHAVDETEPTVETLATEATDATQATETTQSTEATQAAEETKATEATEATQTTEATQAAEETKATEATQATEATESTDATQATEETKATEATETTQPTETQPQETVPETTAPTETQPVETQPEETTVPTETQPERTAYEQIMDIMTALGEEAYHLEATVEVLDEFTQRLRENWNEAYDLNEEGVISDEELEVVDAKGSEILAYLKSEYRYENGVIESLADASARADDISTSNGNGAIKFSLFNYDHTADSNINHVGGTSSALRCIGQYFLFRDGTNYVNGTTAIYGQSAYDKDGFTKDHATVERVLVGGYPVLDLSRYADGTSRTGYPDVSQAARSLDYLFGGKTTDSAVDVYEDVGGSILQKDGTRYYYNSANNAVDYDIKNNQLRLRNYTEKTSATSAYSGYNDFLPFNYTNGELITGQNYNVSSSYSGTSPVADYWYGMTMEVDFYMPKDGKVNGEDMVFKFSGDDDVWVFIDDVLVLDLGGTHGTVDGSINFATGEIQQYLSWNNANAVTTDAEGNVVSDPRANGSSTSFPTTISDCYTKANKQPNGNLNENGTYADYTKHTLKFFYMERGGAVANCKLDFNLPTLPDSSLLVAKDVKGDLTDPDEEFNFKVNLVFEEKPVTSVSYKIDNVIQTWESAAGSYTFKLKAGQTIEFLNIKPGTWYAVWETDANGNPLLDRNAEGVVVEYDNYNGYKYTVELPGNYASQFRDESVIVTYTNTLKTADIEIKKLVSGNMGNRSEDFAFTLKLLDSKGNEAKFPASVTVDNGAISEDQKSVTVSLHHEETIKVSGLPVGTKLVISEMHSDYTATVKQGEKVLAASEEGVPQTSATVEIGLTNEKVVFTNDKEVTIDTGIVLDSLPYILILAGVAVVAVALVLHKRRKYED